MPRFAPHGPIVPDRLVQDLEDDRVVIFCGAGISMGAGLPSYGGLVEHCYTELGAVLPDAKRDDWKWPDRMLGVLEGLYTPEDVRRTVAERLSLPPTDLELHQAILRLARLRRVNGMRLVTTNFDTIFEAAQAGLVLGRDFHSGPVLPIPRNDRIVSWKSIAYLHGRLAPATESNDHLVMTSADFGRAYLTEGWAARFVTRLFADFTVLFIGYSLNDPVLRYMTDAFAAEDFLARFAPRREPAYIFVPFQGRTAPDPQLWRHRRLEPIFYNQQRHHLRLKQTIVAWADAREDFLSSAGAIVSLLARSQPGSLDPSDAENLLWAVVGRAKDEGHGAKVFAHLPDLPPIEWLFEIEERETQLRRAWEASDHRARAAGEPTSAQPILHLDRLLPRWSDGEGEPLTQTAIELIPWLLRHLNSIELADWVIDKQARGRRLHSYLRSSIRRRLDEGDPLTPGFELFWRLVSAEGAWMRSDISEHAFWDFPRWFARSPDALWAREELLAVLRPYLAISKSFFRTWRDAIEAEGGEAEPVGRSIGTVAETVVHLVAADRIRMVVETIDRLPDAEGYLANLATDLSELLRRADDREQSHRAAGIDHDPSDAARPSIQPHAQNHAFREWTVLVDLLWRGWLRIDATSRSESRSFVSRWRETPYLVFRRLVVAAVTVSPHFSADEKLEVLLDGA
jgi:hypothetical protein